MEIKNSIRLMSNMKGKILISELYFQCQIAIQVIQYWNELQVFSRVFAIPISFEVTKVCND